LLLLQLLLLAIVTAIFAVIAFNYNNCILAIWAIENKKDPYDENFIFQIFA